MNENQTRNYFMPFNQTTKQDWLICFNPECTNPNKVIKIFLNDIQDYSQHRRCMMWVRRSSEIYGTVGKESKGSSLELEGRSLDYLAAPIGSIYQLNCLEFSEIQHLKKGYFNKIMASISKKLQGIIDEHFALIKNHYDYNKSILQKMKNYEYYIRYSDKDSALQYYENNLREDLFRVHQMGRITFINQKGLQNHLQIIKKQLQTISYHFWSGQSPQSIQSRLSSINANLKIQNFLNQSESETISKNIQVITSGLKLSQQKLLNDVVKNSIYMSCELCSLKIQSNQGNKQQKRNQCHKSYLKHMCIDHHLKVQKILIDKHKQPIKITLQRLKLQIIANSHKKFILIDRQNINFLKFTENLNEQQYFCLEIVGKQNQNLATVRYMLAESTGKDAADIMIIIALYEIGRVSRKPIVLMTNDHYGKTLEPMFKSFNVEIVIEKYIINQSVINNDPLPIPKLPKPIIPSKQKNKIIYMEIQ